MYEKKKKCNFLIFGTCRTPKHSWKINPRGLTETLWSLCDCWLLLADAAGGRVGLMCVFGVPKIKPYRCVLRPGRYITRAGLPAVWTGTSGGSRHFHRILTPREEVALPFFFSPFACLRESLCVVLACLKRPSHTCITGRLGDLAQPKLATM